LHAFKQLLAGFSVYLVLLVLHVVELDLQVLDLFSQLFYVALTVPQLITLGPQLLHKLQLTLFKSDRPRLPGANTVQIEPV
jgi:hypothetical protein